MRNSPAMLERCTDPNSEENLPTSLKEKVKKASRITTALCLAAIDASLFLPGDSRPYRLEGLTTDGDPRHPTELTIYRLIPDKNSDPAHTDKELYDTILKKIAPINFFCRSDSGVLVKYLFDDIVYRYNSNSKNPVCFVKIKRGNKFIINISCLRLM